VNPCHLRCIFTVKWRCSPYVSKNRRRLGKPLQPVKSGLLPESAGVRNPSSEPPSGFPDGPVGGVTTQTAAGRTALTPPLTIGLFLFVNHGQIAVGSRADHERCRQLRNTGQSGGDCTGQPDRKTRLRSSCQKRNSWPGHRRLACSGARVAR